MLKIGCDVEKCLSDDWLSVSCVQLIVSFWRYISYQRLWKSWLMEVATKMTLEPLDIDKMKKKHKKE